MLIKEIFAADVTRNIAPVVYFHEQDPAKVQEEVAEYIITGGYLESDPRYNRVQVGIHEQFVKLLKGIADELQRSPHVDLPASWISGFYGSGKSSFAKLLGLALDGLVLPDGSVLSDTLLARDDSPKASEFRAVWERVRNQIDPIAVVFDIGAVARDDEQIHSAIKREIQRRLGYCATSHFVADYELSLELDGRWNDFLAHAEAVLGRPWELAKLDRMAEEAFSEVMYVMNPSRYIEPMSWFDSRAGARTGIGTSVAETTREITAMLSQRAAGKTLFIVVDEVSQYIYQNTNRMLALQSFVSDLGQKLKGRVWLLATGQQKLEDSDDESNIGKLKDRFPPKLRVHLAPTNIRDVVHKRLLKKLPTREAELRSLFTQYRSGLKLYGYKCETITEDDFVETYPMLPGYVDLLMQITTNLRTRSNRVKGDDHAIRGLLQLLGELFREQQLGEQAMGALITLEQIYEVQQSALDSDVQNTLARLFNHEEVVSDRMAVRVAKAVALLELIQEQEPTTTELVSQCLYERLGDNNLESPVSTALEKLRNLNLLSYSEKLGYKIQSFAGQDWQRERDGHTVSADTVSGIVSEKLKELLGRVERPGYKGSTFRWAAFYSDGRQQQDERLQASNDLAVITVDFRNLGMQEERSSTVWIPASDTTLRDRLVWVLGKPDRFVSLVRELAKSRHMLAKFASRSQSLPREKQRLVIDEQNRSDTLEDQVQEAVAQALMDGDLYFRGRSFDKFSLGSTFATVLKRAGESVLPELYGHYVDLVVAPSELKQLLQKSLSGPSSKFMAAGLGILELDAGKYNPTCSGQVPTRIEQYIVDQNGIVGSVLLNHFGSPPFGYSVDVIRACLAGLLRAKKIRIRPESGKEITSIQDPDVENLFTRDRDIRRAELLPKGEGGLTARDKVAICQFFKDALGIDLDREEEAIADAAFNYLPAQVRRLQELEQRYNRLPNRPELPAKLVNLRKAVENSVRSRQIEDTVLMVKKHLDDLRDGIQELNSSLADLTDEAVAAVSRAVAVREAQIVQLKQIGHSAVITAAVAAVEEQLALGRPWRDIASLEPHLQAIELNYRQVRLGLIERQEQQAEAIRQRLKQRQGFFRLSEDKADLVFSPIRRAAYDTTQDAFYPSLLELRDTAVLRLQEAEQSASLSLDDALCAVTDEQVIQLPLNLNGKEVRSAEDVGALVKQLEERLLSQLEGKTNTCVRLVYEQKKYSEMP
jgi:Family of unknown function (DUF6079)